MKQKCLLFLFSVFFSVASFAQLRDSVEFNTPYYKIVYSEVLEQPRSAFYRVVCPTANTSRSGMNFYTEPKLHTSDNDDYVNNVWDKGHMAPVGSIRCDKDMVNATFSYANCALQHQRLNRGVWKSLEAYEQRLATQFEEVYVYIRVIFDDEPIRLSTNAAIPVGFYKTIRYGDRLGFIEETFYFPNTDPISKEFTDYKIN